MRRLAISLVAPLALLATATSSSAQPAQSAPRPKTATGLSTWAMYQRTADRSGVAKASFKAPLESTWSTSLDSGVYGEPLIVHGWVIAATENDSVYQLDPGTGKIRWRIHLGKPVSEANLRNDLPDCGDIFPLGITGTPAYDANTDSIFVVAETHGGHHTLWALNAKTGKPRWHRSTDLLPNRDRFAEQQRPALLVSHGRVYTTYGAVSGDCGNYGGYITSTSVTGNGKTFDYAVPTKKGAGMWSAAGPTVGQNGNIYVVSANSVDHAGKWDKSDSVTELTPTRLHRVAAFAPRAWKTDNLHDYGLGSSGPVPVAGRIVIAGKRGPVYLLKPSLGGVGGQIDTLHGCQAYGGAAHIRNIVILPCHSGIRELIVHKHSMKWGWRVNGYYGSPVIAGNDVLVPRDPTGGIPAFVSLIRLSNGQVLSSAVIGPQPHFPSMIAVGNHAFVGTIRGVSAVRGS